VTARRGVSLRFGTRGIVALLVVALVAGVLLLRLVTTDAGEPTVATTSEQPQLLAVPGSGAPTADETSAPPRPHGASRTSRTRAGAVAAGTEYATLLSRLWPLSPAQARAVVADAATEDKRDGLVRSVDRQLVPLQEQARGLGGTTIYRQAVLATKLGGYHEPEGKGRYRAQVSVWLLLTVTRTTAPDAEPSGVPDAQGTFSTVRMELVWERGAWRLADDATTEGPSPAVEGDAVTGQELDRQLSGFEDWRPQ
jgi:hypothetical protein